MKTLDLPPFWLALAILLAWAQARYASLGLSLDHPVTDMLAGLFIGAGVVLTILAALEFRRHKTTIVPHEIPSTIIQSGVYKLSRNPIYLADALILAGAILWLDAVVSLVLVPIFVWWIERHFIVPEENRMRRTFRRDYAAYEQKVRRWL